ncbi:MAG: hypothetical protein ACM3XM_15890 [Mycobacterium leprae]
MASTGPESGVSPLAEMDPKNLLARPDGSDGDSGQLGGLSGASKAIPDDPDLPPADEGKHNVPGEMDQLVDLITGELDVAQMELAQSLAKVLAPSESVDQVAAGAFVDNPPRMNWADYLAYLEQLLANKGKLRTDPRPFYRRWFRPSARERALAWRALATRADSSRKIDVNLPTDEMEALSQEYEHLKAWQSGMVLKVSLYQILWLVVGIGAMLTVPLWKPRLGFTPTEAAATLSVGAFWGIMGACGASLWAMLYYSFRRQLRADTQSGHLLKPVLGAILGTVVVLVAPETFTSDAAAPATVVKTGWLLALLAGFFERSFIDTLHGIMDRLLNKTAANLPAKQPQEGPNNKGTSNAA